MQPIQLFQLASKQAEWLSTRESVVSSNIANANTPGYKTHDVEPFSQVLDASSSAQGGNQMTMVATNPHHFGGAEQSATDIREVESKSLTVTASGNNVAIAHEMMRSSQIRQQYEINTNIVRSLNQMMLMAVRR